MVELPIDLVWGVDVAVKKLRPGAKFGLNGLTVVEWEDPLGTQPPTAEEINEQMEKDRLAAEAWLAAQEKSAAAPVADADKWAS